MPALTRRALVAGLAGLLTACASPSPLPTPQAPPRAAPATPPSTAAPPPPSTPLPTSLPTLAPPPIPTVTSLKHIVLDLQLWNGSAELQLDGQTIEPGRHEVAPGPHQAAAIVDGDVIAIADTPPDGGSVDLVVPPPLAGLAIMIENQADARPQTGLPQADVVYEALAEGGITRFIAVFLSGDSPVVGPVRSLRHYFAFMAADYGADVVHIGASPEGFAWRDAMNMGHLDESAGDPGVWRIRSRLPPHNAYTDTAADRGFLLDRGRQRNRRWGPLRFDPHAPRGEEAAEHITLGFRPWPYRVAYEWDAASERYLRFMEGGPHRDAVSGEQIAPATVVVQSTLVEAIPNDPKLRLDVNLVGGSGQLVVFSGGSRREGTWTKDAPRASSVWLDEHGQPLVIPPGLVWVEVVPLDSPLTYG
jgi:Protein of unknown function (DUF3048) N-terminal domain/Protein of unknown function (DUF3048) C-terminal domain